MPIDKSIKLLAAIMLLLTFVQAPADPTTGQNEGNSATPAQPTAETPTSSPGKTRAEGADDSDNNNPDIQPFTPSETISADSAIAFPADI